MNNDNPRVNAGKSQQYWTSKSGACETTQSKHLLFFFIVIKRTFFPLAKLAIAPKSNPHKTWVVLGDVFISRPMMQTVSLKSRFLSRTVCRSAHRVSSPPPQCFGVEGYSLTCLLGWLRRLHARHIVLSLLSGCPQRAAVLWMCRSRLSSLTLWGVLYVVSSALHL